MARVVRIGRPCECPVALEQPQNFGGERAISWAKGPTYPSLGQRPRKCPQKTKLRAESPAHQSVPHVSLIVFHAILFQKHPELILKRPCAVMIFLVVNIGTQRIQIRRANGKAAITTLPGKCREAGRLRFKPFGRCSFQRFHQGRDGDGARQPDGQMNMVCHAPNPIGLTIRVTCQQSRDRRGVWNVWRGSSNGWRFFRAEDDVDDDEAHRLRHGDGRGLSALMNVLV